MCTSRGGGGETGMREVEKGQRRGEATRYNTTPVNKGGSICHRHRPVRKINTSGRFLLQWIPRQGQGGASGCSP